MTEYKIVYYSANDFISAKFRLENDVVELIKDGWKPLGGATIAEHSGSIYVSQTMIREKET